jgi:hypothetical protein
VSESGRNQNNFGTVGVSGQAAEAFMKEFINDRFMKRIVDEGLLKQLYPGVPAR